MQPCISDYYRRSVDEARSELEAVVDEKVVGASVDEWLVYLASKYFLEPIDPAETRSPELEEIESERRSRAYDIYTDAAPGTVIKVLHVRVVLFVNVSESLHAISQHRLAPNSSYLGASYPRFEYDHRSGAIAQLVRPEKAAIETALKEMREDISAYNSSIQTDSIRSTAELRVIVERRQRQVREKHSKLDTLSVSVGIPLRKKSDPADVVVVAPKVRQKIVPVLPSSARQERPVLDAAVFAGILKLLDNQCRGFERTPQAYASLSEEGLRDILLSTLNAVYEGAAGGETFQGIGKVDIHLRISRGEVFLAEVKVWTGAASLHETVGQLLSRLSWRDSYGVAILLSNNLGFTDVLKTIAAELPKVGGFVVGTTRQPDQHHLCARFSIPSDPARQAELHIVAFNLYTSVPGKRQLRRATTHRP